jgi:Flp pilus assembly protein TadG
LKKKNLLKNQKGATAVEFAIILLLFISLIFAIIEFGLYLFNKQVITNAAREGARYGIVVRSPRWSDAQIVTEVKKFCEDHLVTFGPGTVNIPLPLERDDANENSQVDFGDSLTVKVTYPYDFLFLSNLGIGPLNIQAISRMGME